MKRVISLGPVRTVAASLAVAVSLLAIPARAAGPKVASSPTVPSAIAGATYQIILQPTSCPLSDPAHSTCNFGQTAVLPKEAYVVNGTTFVRYASTDGSTIGVACSISTLGSSGSSQMGTSEKSFSGTHDVATIPINGSIVIKAANDRVAFSCTAGGLNGNNDAQVGQASLTLTSTPKLVVTT